MIGFVAHDGAEGLSPDGWLPDRVSVGALTKAFPPELVDRIVETTDTCEVRRRLLPARLVVYFVLALWLFWGRNCGYGQVLGKLVNGLYHRRRGELLLEERHWDPDGWVEAGRGRSWRIPNWPAPGPGWALIRCTCCSTRSSTSHEESNSTASDQAKRKAICPRPSRYRKRIPGPEWIGSGRYRKSRPEPTSCNQSYQK